MDDKKKLIRKMEQRVEGLLNSIEGSSNYDLTIEIVKLSVELERLKAKKLV